MGVTQTLYSYGDSMSIEAMKQALEALEVATTPLARDRQTVLKAQIELLLAIEQAEKQEPVAWMLDFIDDGFEVKDFVVTKPEYIGAGYNVRPLYTAPSSKEWVGLDDEDWMNVPDFQKEGCELDAAIYDWIEARLKEKNT